MQAKLLRTALFIGLALSMSPLMRGAALTNASLPGTYFFVLEKIDTSIALGDIFTTAKGSLGFNQNGNVTLQGTINRDGVVQSFSASGTFTLAATGDLHIALPGIPLSVDGDVSFDLNSLIASNVASGNLLSQETFLAAKQPPLPITASLINGKYFLSERTITASGSSPQFENSIGTITFDGKGNYNLVLLSNRAGSVTTLNSPGTYQTAADGTVSLTIPSRSGPITLGFTPDGNLGFGATLQQSSGSTHDLFALTKAGSDGLGNAGLNGSYEFIVNAVRANNGFSISAGPVDYTGDGKVSYQLLQNNMGVPGSGKGSSTISVSADASLQFSGVPNTPGAFQGGLGISGHSLVAAAVSDPSLYNFVIAIRTPSQPAAVANAASFSSTVALSPGGLISIFGRNLARQTVLASSLPLPTVLGGASVKIGGLLAPLLFVSPFQINVQVPFEVQPSQVPLTIVLDGVESGPLTVTVNATSPGVFTLTSDGKGTGIFLHSDFSIVSKANPAHPGEVILIYGTGLGAVLPAVADGAGAPGDQLANASAAVSVQINGEDTGVPSFAGLAPGFVGLYQLNVQVPADITTVGDFPVVVTAAGVQSPTVTLPVSP